MCIFVEQNKINDMELEKINYKRSLEEAGFRYLGNYEHSAKMLKSKKNGTITYCIYLAPANMSGYEVCPCSQFCRKFCLNGSGVNRVEIQAVGFEESRINKTRIKKTKLFFENKELFMKIMIHEIIKTRRYAEKHGMEFSVRLNGTSDISPEDFVYKGENILNIFPDVQFYDYTKVYSRIDLLKKYPNYDLTYSYNGHNWGACKKFLEMGGKVAVVFNNKEMLPMAFDNYPVIDANGYDMRYLDPPRTIMGLHYHRTAANYENGVYVEPNEDFVVKDDNNLVQWYE